MLQQKLTPWSSNLKLEAYKFSKYPNWYFFLHFCLIFLRGKKKKKLFWSTSVFLKSLGGWFDFDLKFRECFCIYLDLSKLDSDLLTGLNLWKIWVYEFFGHVNYFFFFMLFFPLAFLRNSILYTSYSLLQLLSHTHIRG